MQKPQFRGAALLALDPYLAPYADRLRRRFQTFVSALERFAGDDGIEGPVSHGHTHFGFNRGTADGQAGVWYREWAPCASALYLIGDFNNWDRRSHPLNRDEWGAWNIFLSDRDYAGRLTHGSRVKIHVVGADEPRDRIPAYIRRVVQDPRSHNYDGIYWNPPPFAWKHASPSHDESLRIYEAHVGMATEQERVGSYLEFAHNILPRIADLGFNAVQLMAVQEHPYYGSFGYHVSNFFAPSSRFGTPEELKELIDAAHGLGLRVLLDVVHSHAVKNINEGINRFDGTDHQYTHGGGRGQHTLWDSVLFDYGKYEVIRFLLSNLRYWMEEFRFDGFRFDGVTSMLYLDHGLGRSYSGYEEYFGGNVDEEAVNYLQLANTLVHTIKPDAITVAEDVSGLPGMARPVEEGGLGFDYRLAMGIPDYWIKLCKETPDENWKMGELFGCLLNRRYGEKHVAYSESHDQALVGDQTLAFRMMGSEMYTQMRRSDRSPAVERGCELHKMIRLLTLAAGGEAWLGFMGNEFGHPEWIDFPREGNGFSYKFARRQWSLVDNGLLRYGWLNDFERELHRIDRRCRILADGLTEGLLFHEADKLLVFRRGPVLFAFNFHPSKSQPGLRIPAPDPYDFRLISNTDDPKFGGQGRVAIGQVCPLQMVPAGNRPGSVQIYLPARTAQVYEPVK